MTVSRVCASSRATLSCMIAVLSDTVMPRGGPTCHFCGFFSPPGMTLSRVVVVLSDTVMPRGVGPAQTTRTARIPQAARATIITATGGTTFATMMTRTRRAAWGHKGYKDFRDPKDSYGRLGPHGPQRPQGPLGVQVWGGKIRVVRPTLLKPTFQHTPNYDVCLSCAELGANVALRGLRTS